MGGGCFNSLHILRFSRSTAGPIGLRPVSRMGVTLRHSARQLENLLLGIRCQEKQAHHLSDAGLAYLRQSAAVPGTSQSTTPRQAWRQFTQHLPRPPRDDRWPAHGPSAVDPDSASFHMLAPLALRSHGWCRSHPCGRPKRRASWDTGTWSIA